MGRKLKKPRIRPAAAQDVDGLSSLPDAILVDILSLLPLKSAVSTAVLSSRWRHLWTQTTSVDIDCRHFKDFYTTVDQLLPKLTSPIIRNFTLRVPLKPEPEASSPPRSLVIGSWLQRVCARKVEKIVVAVEGSGNGDVVIDTLPACIFNTRSLVRLVLGCMPSTKLDYKLPVEIDMHNHNMIDLPNLVKLHLNLYASQCGLVSKLIRCCPLLEKLWLGGVGNWELLSNGEDGFVVVISNDNVKRLNVMLPFASKAAKFVVDAPNLTSIILIASFVTCSFVRKPVSLREASVFCFGEAQVRSLLPVICNVFLLRAYPLIFHALNGGFGDETTPWNFPNLRRLHFHCGGFTGIDDVFSLLPVDSVPAGRLLRHVKRIEIKTGNVINGKNLLHFAKGLLANAPVLEWLVIRVTDQNSSDMNVIREEALFVPELYGYPRISSQCLIEFYGQYIKLPARVEALQALARHFEDLTREVDKLLDISRRVTTL